MNGFIMFSLVPVVVIVLSAAVALLGWLLRLRHTPDQYERLHGVPLMAEDGRPALLQQLLPRPEPLPPLADEWVYCEQYGEFFRQHPLPRETAAISMLAVIAACPHVPAIIRRAALILADTGLPHSCIGTAAAVVGRDPECAAQKVHQMMLNRIDPNEHPLPLHDEPYQMSNALSALVTAVMIRTYSVDTGWSGLMAHLNILHRLSTSAAYSAELGIARDSGIQPDWTGPHWNDTRRELLPQLLALYRDPRLLPRHRTSDVVALARGILADHAPDRLPILADALQDADYDGVGLGHLRDAAVRVSSVVIRLSNAE